MCTSLLSLSVCECRVNRFSLSQHNQNSSINAGNHYYNTYEHLLISWHRLCVCVSLPFQLNCVCVFRYTHTVSLISQPKIRTLKVYIPKLMPIIASTLQAITHQTPPLQVPPPAMPPKTSPPGVSTNSIRLSIRMPSSEYLMKIIYFIRKYIR
jgi:hypothetical protein